MAPIPPGATHTKGKSKSVQDSTQPLQSKGNLLNCGNNDDELDTVYGNLTPLENPSQKMETEAGLAVPAIVEQPPQSSTPTTPLSPSPAPASTSEPHVKEIPLLRDPHMQIETPTIDSTSNIEILYFPIDCPLNDQQKQQWFREAVGHGHHVCIRPGRLGLLVGSYTAETTFKLTTAGFRNVVLQKPITRELSTKVIIMGLTGKLDLDLFTSEFPALAGAAWNKISRRGTEIIGYWKGASPPDRLFSKTFGLSLSVQPYVRKPTMCGKCSKWNHPTKACRSQTRCRYCGRNHLSQQCLNKIRNGEEIEYNCVHCGGKHSAGNSRCPQHPNTLPSLMGPSQIPPQVASTITDHTHPDPPTGQTQTALPGQSTETQLNSRGVAWLSGPQAPLLPNRGTSLSSSNTSNSSSWPTNTPDSIPSVSQTQLPVQPSPPLYSPADDAFIQGLAAGIAENAKGIAENAKGIAENAKGIAESARQTAQLQASIIEIQQSLKQLSDMNKQTLESINKQTSIISNIISTIQVPEQTPRPAVVSDVPGYIDSTPLQITQLCKVSIGRALSGKSLKKVLDDNTIDQDKKIFLYDLWRQVVSINTTFRDTFNGLFSSNDGSNIPKGAT